MRTHRPAISVISCPAEGWAVELLAGDLVKITLINKNGRPESRTFPRHLAKDIAIGLLQREFLRQAPAANPPGRPL